MRFYCFASGRAPAVFFLAAVLVCAGVAPAFAEVVREIRIEKSDDIAVDDSFVLSRISSKVGTEAQPDVVAADIKMLLDTQRFSYVGTRTEPAGDGGVALVYIVKSRHRVVGAVVFNGLTKMSRATALKTTGLASGVPVDKHLVDAAAERLRKEYVKMRFFDAKVSGTMVAAESADAVPGAVLVTFNIAPGARNRVSLIEFEGNRKISSRLLRRASGQSPWWNPSGWFASPRVTDFDLETLRSDARKQYLDLGFLDVDVSEPQKTREDNTWSIRYDIAEGAQYRVGTLDIEGVTLFPLSQIKAAIPLKPGDVAGVETMLNTRTAIADFFRARGYVDTQVRYTTVPDSERPGVLNVTYTVAESAIAKVRNIVIRGNTHTKDKVIRREIPLDPGDIYNSVVAERSRRRLMNLGYFSDVRQHDIRVEEGVRDVVYDLDEQNTGSMMVGLGFSSVDHLIGFFEISQSNFDLFNWPTFKGAGQKARIGLQVSSDTTDLEASFTEPWLFDRRLALNVDGFIRNRSYNEYDETRAGASVGLSRHVPMIGRVGLTYTLQHVSLDDIIEGEFYRLDEPDRLYSYTDEDDGYMLGSLRLGWSYDTRNNGMIPTAGTRATFGTTLYGTFLGGEHDFYELDFTLRNYQELFYGHVLSFYLRASVVDTFDEDEDVPVTFRYFMGGGRNPRGWRHRAIGPKVVRSGEEAGSHTYRPVGGQTRLQGSVEYTIPIVKYLRLAAFVDAGNVWEDSYDFDFGEIAASYGGGVRLDFPGFPIRFDYAQEIESDDDISRKRAFVIWFGYDN